MKTKVSVIVPVYNKEKYINNLLEDLRNQTFADYECVLVDDGSIDNSGKLCEDISKIDKRFKTFHLKNAGVSNARNYGVRQAKGEYITFVDADDRLHPEYIGNLFRCIKENKVDIVISGLEKYWIDSGNTKCVKIPYLGKKEKASVISQFAEVQKNTGIFGFCVAKIFSKELIEEIQFDTDLVLAEDFDFYLKLYKKIETFYFDDKCYYRYLQCTENSSGIIEDDKINYMAQLMINLRYKKFFISQKAYNGKNKKIVDEIINNYIYYVIFYSSYDELSSNFIKLQEVINIERIELKGRTVLQKWIFFLMKIKQYRMTKYTIFLYRSIRKILRK